MAQQRLGIIMNGVTGRMGMNQHLIRSICAIRDQGGVALKNGDRVMPDPILVGRNAERVQKLAKAHGVSRWTTDLDAALKDKKDTLFFDAATTQLRAELLKKAMKAGKHIYCEKPVSETLKDALDLVRVAKKAGIKHGVVQDKLFLPGLLKLKLLIDSGFFGRILVGARRVRLLGVRGRLAAGAAAVLELQEGRGRRHHSRHGLPLALRARQPVRRCRERHLPRRDAYPEAGGRERQDLHQRRRRRGLRHLPAQGRRHRPYQHVLVHARAP